MKLTEERLHELAKGDIDIWYSESQSMAKELLALRKLIPKEGEVLIALNRIEGYEDVSAELLAEDAMNNPEPWQEWRLIDFNA